MTPPGTTASELAELAALGTATVYEASGLDCALDPAIRPAWRGASVTGPAFTVACPAGDNLAVHRALESVSPGNVLVVAAGGALFGYWGEVLTVAARARGVVGLVIDGGVRDAAAVECLAFPVRARASPWRAPPSAIPASSAGRWSPAACASSAATSSSVTPTA